MYFGWFIVAIAALNYMLVVGTTFTAFGLFVIPVSAELELSRANMNSAMILLYIGTALLAPFIGRMLDRFPVRRIMMVSAILLGLSFAGLGLSQSLWVSVAILCVTLPAAMLGVSSLTMPLLIARWFTVQRGRAMVLGVIGMSIGGVVVTPIVAWLIERDGWRGALLTIGGATGVILFVLATIIRERPGANDVEGGRPAAAGAPPATGADAPPSTVVSIKSVLRQPKFWLIALSASIAMGIALAISITLVPLGIDRGLTLMQATGLISVAGGAAVGGKLLISVFADRIDRVLLLSGLFSLGVLLNGALFLGSGYAMLLVCAAASGIASGAIAPIFYALVADQFGTASFGTVRGLMAPIIAVVGALAMRLAGEIFDRTGGYDTLFLVFMFAGMLAVALMYASRLTKPAELAPVLSPVA